MMPWEKGVGMIDVGVVGFGLAGRYLHAQVIRAVPGLRLAAVVQRSSDEAARIFPGTKVVRSLEELLAMESIRLIVIASPNQTHFAYGKQCLNAGRDVMVDKPITPTVAEAIELFSLAKRLGRVLTVFHSRRFDADFQSLREVIESGELGEIKRLDSYYDRYRPAPKPGAWREQPGPGSGIFYDLAPHMIDHALMLFGQPESLAADLRTERSGMATDDAFDLWLQYPQSLRVHLAATMLAVTARARFTVLGSKGSFVKQEFDGLELAMRSGNLPSGSWLVDSEEKWGEVAIAEETGVRRRKVQPKGDWRQFYENVRDVLLGKAELVVTPQQILDVMQAMELSQESNLRHCAMEWRSVEAP